MRQAVVQPIAGVVGNATITSAAIDFRQIYRLSGQVVVGAGAATAGSLQLQYSDDPASITLNHSPPTATNWSNFGTAVTVSGAAVQSIVFSTIPFTEVCYAWVRAVYTDSSSGTGLGTITVNLNIQGF